MNPANKHQKIEIVESRRPCQVLNHYDRNHKSTQVCYRPGLVPVKIVGRDPTIPKYVPVCMVINARSLAKVNAVPALFAELTHNNVDICTVSETWLNSTIPNHFICPNGYSIIRKDRREQIGGVIDILCRHNWQLSGLGSSFHNIFECLWVKVQTPSSVYYITALYNHPDTDQRTSLDLIDHP